MEKLREAFQDWMREIGHQDNEFDRLDDDDEQRPGEYEDWFVELPWLAWKAGMAHGAKTVFNRNEGQSDVPTN